MDTQVQSVKTEVNIPDVIKESWDKVNGAKGVYWGAIGFCVAVSLVVSLLMAVVGGITGLGGTWLFLIIYQLLVYGAMGVVQAGVLMLVIKRLRGEPVKLMMTFDYIDRALDLFLLILAMYVLIFIGFLLFILPGVYLAVCYAFAMPVMIEKKLGIWETLETTRKAVTPYWFQVFFTYLVAALIMVISAIPLGIGLIWTIPMQLNVLGNLYLRIFGSKE